MRYALTKIIRHKQRGFTLVELLVATLIFGIISTLTVTSLQSVIKVFQRIELQSTELNHLQLAFAHFSQDFSQYIPQKIIDRTGEPLKEISSTPSIVLDINPRDINLYLEFLRSGVENANPATERQSNLRRVAYVYTEDKFIRYTWEAWDQTQQRPFVTRQVLLTDIYNLEIGFYNKRGDIIKLSNSRDIFTDKELLLQAIELTINFNNGEHIKRLFALDMQQQKPAKNDNDEAL